MIVNKKIKNEKIILFDKNGVMKMIAKIEKTSDGYDIINRSKQTKYIHIAVQNSKPIMLKSYVSDWSMLLEGAGKFQLKKVSKSKVDALVSNRVSSNLSANDKMLKIESMKLKGSNFYVTYRASISYPDALSKSDQKRYCKKNSKRYSKKISNVSYFDDRCEATLYARIKKNDLLKPLKDELISQYPQLKWTKKFRLSKKGVLMYKVIEKVQ